jgi:hypothetical protein
VSGAPVANRPRAGRVIAILSTNVQETCANVLDIAIIVERFEPTPAEASRP